MTAKDVFLFSRITSHVYDLCSERRQSANSHSSGMRRSTVSVSDGQFALAAAFC